MFQQSGFRAKIKKLGVLSSQYTAITVLRLLLWLDGDSPYREIVLNMEDHDQERRRHQPDTWNMQKHLIVNFIQKVRINGIKCKTPGVEFRLQIDLSSRLTELTIKCKRMHMKGETLSCVLIAMQAGEV